MTLKETATAYKELIRYQYVFLLSHKGKAETLTISFPKEAFHHLAGLHKKQLERTKNKKHILDSILEDGIPDQIAVTDEILDRWECICNLKEMIESNRLVFRLIKHMLPGSRIEADYVLSDNIHLFFVNDGIPVSVFTAWGDKLKNVSRCLRLTTLKIERRDMENETLETVYISDRYRPEE